MARNRRGTLPMKLKQDKVQLTVYVTKEHYKIISKADNMSEYVRDIFDHYLQDELKKNKKKNAS